jgi:hypothetical protein
MEPIFTHINQFLFIICIYNHGFKILGTTSNIVQDNRVRSVLFNFKNIAYENIRHLRSVIPTLPRDGTSLNLTTIPR